ncbi:hypothetical protein WDW86_03235 [Bdellovibrionota bacterium FG-2]
MATLERILGLGLAALMDTVLREGERFAKIKLFSLSLEILKGARRVTLYYFYGFFACILCTAAVFSFLIYGVTRFAVQGRFPVDAFTVSAAAITALSFGLALWFLREKRWVEAFGLQNRIAAVVQEGARERAHESESARVGLREDQLLRLIDKLLDEKLARREEEKARVA